MPSAPPGFAHGGRAVLLVFATVYCQSVLSQISAPVQICAEKVLNNDTQYLKNCGTRWAIMNKNVVIEYWQVHEVRFYWDGACTVELPVTTSFHSSVMSTMFLDTSEKAFDDDLFTTWTANCRYLLGGCLPQQEYVGVDASGFNPVNFNTNSHYSNVRCVKLYQSKNVTLQATEIHLVTWLNETDFYVVADYSTLTGGAWVKRPAMENQLWKFWNNQPTERPWRVAEFMLYSDIFCTRLVTSSDSVVISSLPYHAADCVDELTCDEFKATYMVDGTLRPGEALPDAMPTYWRANCGSEWTGCPADAAWFGVDFGEAPQTVRCVRIYQPAYDGYPGFGFSTYTSELRSQSWDGYKWIEQNLMKGLQQGGWNDTVPAYKSAWRLSNYDKMENTWMIFEVGFYEDVECAKQGATMVSGLPISSNELRTFTEQEALCRQQLGSCAGLSFDTILDTAWESDCVLCDQRDAWIGIYFRGDSAREVKCFKILQSLQLKHQTAVVELSYWSGKDWEVARVEAEVGGGTWNFRPAEIKSMFRVLSNSVTEEPWTLTGFQMYDDTDCLAVSDTMHLVSGSTILNSVDGAFDDDEYTYWEASCTPPSPTSPGCSLNSAWLGGQAYGVPMDVKCIRIQQHRLRARQVTSVRLQEWDGIQWKPSSRFPEPIVEMGGGAWQMLPGSRGSMWRVATTPTRRGFGVSELEFYRSGDCKAGHIKYAPPNFMPICSAFQTAREVSSATGYNNHLRVIGDFAMTSPELAFDQNQGSFWADLTNELSWVGLDSTTQVMDIQCVKIALAGEYSLQAEHAEVQAWTGFGWATLHSANTIWTRALPFALPFPSGSGLQQRPTVDRSMWRLQNDESIAGWEIMEVRMYMFVDCSGPPLTGTPISSLPAMTEATANGGHTVGANVFDDDLVTRWNAECRGQDCAPGTAWIGVDAGASTVTTCFRIIQSGRRELQATKIALAVWLKEEWTIVEHYKGFGGETWNQRPAGPDTLWRVSLVVQKTELCAGQTRDSYMRSWGVSELEFYSDDKCETRLPMPSRQNGTGTSGVTEGARVLVSGTREPDIAVVTSKKVFDPGYAFDGNTRTYWAAQCGNQKGNDAAFCAAGYEWIGVDYLGVDGGSPKDVRCFKIHQNRASRRECCDPASELILERWNGTDWAIAQWRHVSHNKDMTIPGRYERMGKCPSLVEQSQGGGDDFWETRKRRQSETCIIPLAASVKLLSDSLCDKHSECAEAGFGGQCCPYNAQTAESRCCCDFLTDNEVFEDEMEKDADRNIKQTAPTYGLEYIVIRSVVVLPFVGLAVSLIVFILANIPQPAQPIDYPPSPSSGGRCRRCCRCCSKGCGYRLWSAMCGPLQRWLGGTSPFARAMAFFIIRNPKEKAHYYRIKVLLWFVIGFVGGGCSVYLLIAYLIAELFILLTVILSLTMRLAKSPYVPGDPADKKRMNIILALPFDGESPLFGENPLGKVASQFGATVVIAVAYGFRAIFDFIIMRYALMNLGLVDIEISVKDILTAMPDFGIDIKPYIDVMYEFVAQSSKVFQAAFIWLFEGVPQCEGPVILFSGMWLVAVTMVLVRWLNYDVFAVFSSGKNVMSHTRPMFQKACGAGTMLSIQAGMFLFMQCVMLLFARALTLVNPMEESNKQWNCPYDGDGMSIIVGRILLTCAALVACVLTFLCANGHFLGQDYIVREYSHWIGMNLTGLDPDGVGDTGGFLRFDSFLSMIPTTFGIWIDGWNVRGYMIKKRAEIYAEELNLPLECPICGCAHVPYSEIMRATGMQTSLAYQLIPFGIVIGKACEYLNNPPLLYCGKELKCYHSNRYMKHVLDGLPKKANCFGTLQIWGALIVAACKDIVLPLFARLCALGMYVLILFLVFTIDKVNVANLMKDGFTIAAAVACSKAVCEFVMPAIVVVILTVVLYFVMGPNKSVALERDKRNPIPVVGGVINGLGAGVSVTLYFLNHPEAKDGTMKDAVAILLGVLIGVGSSFGSLILALVLEWFHHSRVIAAGLLFLYLIAASIAFGFLATSTLLMSERLIISIGAAIVMTTVTGLTFLPPTIGRGGPKAVKVESAAVLPLFTTARCISAPIGVFAGVFAAGKIHDMFIDGLGEYYGLGFIVLVSVIVALVYSLATDAVIQKPAAQVGLTVGTLIAFVIGLFWLWFIGLIVGAVVGCILGAIIEHCTMTAVMAETVLMQPGDAEELKETSRLDGTVGAGRGPREGVPLALGPYTPDEAEIKALTYYDNQALEDNVAIAKAEEQQLWARKANVSTALVAQEQPRALVDRTAIPSPSGSKRFGLKSGTESPGGTMQTLQGTQASAESTAAAYGWVGNVRTGGIGHGEYVRQGTQASTRSLSSPAPTSPAGTQDKWSRPRRGPTTSPAPGRGTLDQWNQQRRGTTSPGPGARGTAQGGTPGSRPIASIARAT